MQQMLEQLLTPVTLKIDLQAYPKLECCRIAKDAQAGGCLHKTTAGP